MDSRDVTSLLTLLPLCFLMTACTGTRPSSLGIESDHLAACPSTPNCVSSDAAREAQRVDGLAYSGSPSTAWLAVRQAVLELPRTKVTTEEDGYLRAESTSFFFRFVDDLELHHRPSLGIIAVRSASRIGRSDFGVNRKRVEQLRTLLSSKLESSQP
jgi:uncharacterized protein (DUF1499 family)